MPYSPSTLNSSKPFPVSQSNLSSWNTSIQSGDTVNTDVSEHTIQTNKSYLSRPKPAMPMYYVDNSAQQQTAMSTNQLPGPDTGFSPVFLDKEDDLFDTPLPSMDLASLVQDTQAHLVEEKDSSVVTSWFEDRPNNELNGQNDFQYHRFHPSQVQSGTTPMAQPDFAFQRNLSPKSEPHTVPRNNHSLHHNQRVPMANVASNSEQGKQPMNPPSNIQGYPQMMVPGVIMCTMPVMGNFPPQMLGMMPVGMPFQMNVAPGMQFPHTSPVIPSNGMPYSVKPSPSAQAKEDTMNRAAPPAQATPFMEPTGFVNPTMLLYSSGHPVSGQGLSSFGQFAAFQPVVEPLNRKPNFVTIARKPEKPQASNILKSLMQEEAKKKEKKLERNRDSARESRRKQQSYVGMLENGIKRLQLNREYIASYQWGLTTTENQQNLSQKEHFGINQYLSIVCGENEYPSYVEDFHVLEKLIASTRHRRAVMSLSGRRRGQLVAKCFGHVGTLLARIRDLIIALQMLSQVDSPFTKDLETVLQLTHTQKEQLSALHLSERIRSEIYAFIMIAKAFTALQTQAHKIVHHASALELPFSRVCASKQLQKLLQFAENEDTQLKELLYKPE
uniref:Uncharacterized protein AlNc14C153G7571 n=1 Tax=Albugo laibachii Nc14 TaxID=890382 RepID=F0WM68_9STRA|nr:conserved hypothetical protein [Albugo laibachii Nc14]|eukprot:CCA22396.1 conserved hypothetical protein [Albugo laibachii Nc14]